VRLLTGGGEVRRQERPKGEDNRETNIIKVYYMHA
jgi:hypothetical protein